MGRSARRGQRGRCARHRAGRTRAPAARRRCAGGRASTSPPCRRLRQPRQPPRSLVPQSRSAPTASRRVRACPPRWRALHSRGARGAGSRRRRRRPQGPRPAPRGSRVRARGRRSQRTFEQTPAIATRRRRPAASSTPAVPRRSVRRSIRCRALPTAGSAPSRGTDGAALGGRRAAAGTTRHTSSVGESWAGPNRESDPSTSPGPPVAEGATTRWWGTNCSMGQRSSSMTSME